MLHPTSVSALFVALLAVVALPQPHGLDARWDQVADLDCQDAKVAQVVADLRIADFDNPYQLEGFATVDGRIHFRYRPVANPSHLRVQGALVLVAVGRSCGSLIVKTGDRDATRIVSVDERKPVPGASAAIASGTLRGSAEPLVLHSSVLDVADRTSRLFDRYHRASGEAVVVDQRTGLIMQVADGSPHGLVATDGSTVDATLPSELSRADDRYVTMTGTAYQRDPGAGSPVLQPVYRLHGEGDRLDGKYLRVTSASLDSDGLPTPQSGAGEFIYEPIVNTEGHCELDPPTCSLLDNVNAYVHIDRFAHEFWFERLGIEPGFQATVVTHQTNSLSRVRVDTISVGWGGMFLNNNALEDEILYHEYTHTILRHLGFATDIFSSVQRRALGEGYADYFALTYADQAELGDWATRCPPRYECAGPEDATEIRTLDTDPAVWNWNFGVPSARLKYGVCTRKHLGDSKCKTSWMTFDDTYVWGMIWGSALWDIRKELGAETTDRLVAMSIVLTGGELYAKTSAAGAILFANRQLNDGAHEQQLREIFQARGIAPHLAAWTSTESDDETREMDWQVSPNPFTSSVRMQATLTDAGTVTATLYDLSGRLVRTFNFGVRPAGQLDETLDLPDLARGRYLLSLRTSGTASGANSGTTTATKLVIRAR